MNDVSCVQERKSVKKLSDNIAGLVFLQGAMLSQKLVQVPVRAMFKDEIDALMIFEEPEDTNNIGVPVNRNFSMQVHFAMNSVEFGLFELTSLDNLQCHAPSRPSVPCTVDDREAPPTQGGPDIKFIVDGINIQKLHAGTPVPCKADLLVQCITATAQGGFTIGCSGRFLIQS